jgi:hypothetical protein
MWGIPEHEELRRFRASWYAWGRYDRTRPGPDQALALKKRLRTRDAHSRTWDRVRHLRRPDLSGSFALRNLTHPRWCRTRPKRQSPRAP